MSGTDFIATLLLVNLAVAVTVATVLLISLPKRVHASLGTMRRVLDCWVGFLVVTVVALLPLNSLLVFVHETIIPWPLALEAIECVFTGQTDDSTAASEMDDIRRQHSDWYQRHGGSPEASREVQLGLLDNWPWILGAVVLLLFASFVALSRFYSRLVRSLEKAAEVPNWEEVVEDLYQKESQSRKHRRRRRHVR